MSVPSCFLLNMDKCPVFHLTSKASPEVKAESRSKCAVLLGLKGILEKILVDTSTGEWLLIVFWFPRKTLQSVLSKIMNKTIILKNVGSSFGLNQKDTITTWMYCITYYRDCDDMRHMLQCVNHSCRSPSTVSPW